MIIKTISPEDIARLKKPCENRKVKLIDNKDGSVSISNGSEVKHFGHMTDVENYLLTLPRFS